MLTAIYNGSTLDEVNEEADYSGFFNAPEQVLMAASPIKTRATGRGLGEGEYTTTDYLYAPRSAVDRDPISGPSSFDVLVAGANDLKINMAHWAAFLGCARRILILAVAPSLLFPAAMSAVATSSAVTLLFRRLFG